MVTERELIKAIKECEQDPITASKRTALADLYIIYDHLYGDRSSALIRGDRANDITDTDGSTEFLAAINGKKLDDVWRLVSQVIEVVRSLHPRVYDSLMDDIAEL